MAKTSPQPSMAEPLIDKRVLGVGLRFFVYLLVFTAVLTPIDTSGGLQGVMRATANASTWLIALTGIQATQTGALIHLSNRILAIDTACTAVYLVAMFSALILAYPVKWSSRLLGVLAGVVVILGINLARIVAVAHVSIRASGSFDFIHDYLFQVGMMLVVVMLWAIWLKLARRYA